MKIKPLILVQASYNLLIPLQIVAAIYIEKGSYQYAVPLIITLMALESVGIKYWIIAQSEHLNNKEES